MVSKRALSLRKVMAECSLEQATIHNVPKEDGLWNNYGMEVYGQPLRYDTILLKIIRDKYESEEWLP